VTGARWPLSPRAGRVFYNVADAWIPGGGDVDAVAALAAVLGAPAERRRLERALWLLEWSPRFALRSLRGLSWMAREPRRAWLDRLAQSRIAFVRDAAEVARRNAEAALEHARHSAHSLPGA
jgi:hypothetical protein